MPEESKDVPVTEWVYTPLTDEQLEKLAWDIMGGAVFGTWSHPDAARMCFLILMFLDKPALEAMEKAEIVHAYQYMSQAGERSVNGMPMFMSSRFLNKADTAKLQVRLDEIKAFKEQRQPKAT